MRHMITQEDGMGCGAACVAFAANKTYQQAAKVLGREKARSVGFHLKELVDALSGYGLDYRSRHVKQQTKQAIYQQGVIVFIKRSARYPYGHYLIRHNGLWADPWVNLVLDKSIERAKSGYRKRLPGEAQWAILPKK
jgi:hypothetical protein